MSAFIKIKTYHNGIVVDALVNVDRIVMVWDANYRDDMEGQCFYSMIDGFSTEHAAEPYETVVGKIIAATSKEKENLPELQKTLRAIRRHRVRRKIFSALKIGANVYRERLSRLTKILEIST